MVEFNGVHKHRSMIEFNLIYIFFFSTFFIVAWFSSFPSFFSCRESRQFIFLFEQ